MTVYSLSYPVAVDPSTQTIRPISDSGDDYFGLAPMTNGSAAECRRALVAPTGFRWLRSSGRAPLSIHYVVP
jgi:hypothetical protein